MCSYEWKFFLLNFHFLIVLDFRTQTCNLQACLIDLSPGKYCLTGLELVWRNTLEEMLSVFPTTTTTTPAVTPSPSRSWESLAATHPRISKNQGKLQNKPNQNKQKIKTNQTKAKWINTKQNETRLKGNNELLKLFWFYNFLQLWTF